MKFGWDKQKSDRNFVERGLSFSLAESLFECTAFEVPDDRRDYDEQRIRAYAILNGRLLACVYTDRVIAGRSVRWIISLRKANAPEGRKYNDWVKTEDSG